jgi:hypothetical protein
MDFGLDGNTYAQLVQQKNPAESEIIINVPLALKNNDYWIYSFQHGRN